MCAYALRFKTALSFTFFLGFLTVGLWMAPSALFAQSPGLVAAYSFDEGGGSAITDLSGNGNHGSLGNALWTSESLYGNALLFNGVDALVTIPDSPSLRLTNAMTLEAWVNPA